MHDHESSLSVSQCNRYYNYVMTINTFRLIATSRKSMILWKRAMMVTDQCVHTVIFMIISMLMFNTIHMQYRYVK